MNRLTLIEDLGLREYGTQGYKKRWGLYECECGKLKEICNGDLKSGRTKSCGCYKTERTKEINTSHGMRKDGIYGAWYAMIRRCNNKEYERYYDYGGRGIKVCEDWFDVVKFRNWAYENGYKKGLQIDRINNDGNYEPSNCQFITGAENAAIGKKRKQINNLSSFIGVYFHNVNKKWCAQIVLNKKYHYLGTYLNINDAVESRIAKEIEVFGKQRTNFNYIKGDSL